MPSIPCTVGTFLNVNAAAKDVRIFCAKPHAPSLAKAAEHRLKARPNHSGRLLISLLAVLLAAAPSGAAVLSWSGGSGTSGNWSDSANWGFAGTPANGDTLIFPGGQPRLSNTNNLGALTLTQIRFVGAGGGYNIFGNALTVNSGIQATNTTGPANTLNNDLTLASSSIVNVGVSGVNLTLFGVVSGGVGLTKNGAGTLTLAGPLSNTYGGMTTINGGLVELMKNGFPAATAIPGDLTINAGATARNIYSIEIADTCSLVIDGGTWDVNGQNETVGSSLTLTNNGFITTGTGTCNLSPNPTITVGDGTINGRLDISSGTCTVQISSSLSISAIVSGTANIIKNGGGSLYLGGTNTFTGSLTANGANYLYIVNAQGLGTSAGGTTMNDDTWLAIGGAFTVTNEALALNSANESGVYVFGGTNTWTGNITFGTNVTFQVFTNSGMILSGTLSGPGGITKIGPGSLFLSSPDGSSDYFGDTTVQEGFLFLNSVNVIRHGTLTIGDGWGGPNSDIVRYLKPSCIFGGLASAGSSCVIRSTGLLDLNNFDDDAGPFLLDGGNITTGTGTLTLFQPVGTYQSSVTNGSSTISGKLRLREDSTFSTTNGLNMNASVSSLSTYTLIKNGTSTMVLNSSNSYSGLTVVQQGLLWAANNWALGGTINGTVVSNQATLAISGASITNESLSLNGVGIASNWGNLDSEGSGVFWTGPITVNNIVTILPYSVGNELHILGPISGPGGVRLPSTGSGTLFFEGPSTNTYAGGTFIDSGTNALNKPGSLNNAIPGNLTISGTVRIGAGQQINDNADVLVNPSGLLDCGANAERIDTLRGNGKVQCLAFGWIEVGSNDGSSTFDGIISGPGYPGGYTVGKFGTGTFTLNGNNTYLNQTRTFAGTTVVNGFQPQSPAVINAGATLSGSGTVGDIFCSGNLRPGSSPGILTCSNLTFTSSGVYYVDINGAVAGTGYDQLNVRGTNNLASAALGLILNLTSPVAVGDQLTIINNDASELFTGIFAGWPQGTTYSAGGFALQLSYTGGTGNDAVFTVLTVPAVGLSAAVSGGNGKAFVAIDECNNVSIMVTNLTATPMTGVSATLSTTTFGVEVTQPYSYYPVIPSAGSGTNITGFQVSTLPTLACGSPITLQLSLVTASHGAFTVPLTVPSGVPAVVPTRYDNSTSTNIPDVGTIESTNVVVGFASPLSRVEVSLWLTHPFEGDLSIALVAPNGTVVDLTSGNGAGPNFGTGCSPDANRTTFSDLAATPVTAGASPFVGTFRPEVALSNVLSSVADGNWRLRVTDGLGGTVGALRCWSLFLYGTTCGSGGGACGTCLTTVSGSITTGDLVQTGRFTRNGTTGSCGDTKPCPGLIDITPRNYDVYMFTNFTATNACVSVLLQNTCGDNVYTAAYQGVYDPSNLCANYLSDPGTSSSQEAMSFTVPAGGVYSIVVHELTPNSGCSGYTLQFSGLPCAPPLLNITSVGSNERIYWTNSAGGYLLEGTPSLGVPAWTDIATQPTNNGGFFNVTNPPTGDARFYRLRKP